MRVFNEQLDQGQGEDEASKMAWAAVERAGYSKGENGKWSKYMDFETSFELHEDGTFELGVPLMKIDLKKRIVSGFATLNNLDQAGDIVDIDASEEAFSKWFGNIREMHQKDAVGRAVDWRRDTYTDDDGNEYEGIWVDAKISKGAENTWQKCVDGTLAGFSIGGVTKEKERVLAKDGDKNVAAWRITKYGLNELSLVDSPCNQLACFSLVKSIDGGDFEFGESISEELDKGYNGETGEFVDFTPALESVVRALENWRDEALRANADNEVARISELLSGVRSKKRMECNEAEYYDSVQKSDDKEENMSDEKIEKTADDLQDKNDSVITSVEELTGDDAKGILQKFVDFVKSDKTEKVEEPLNKEGDEMDSEELTKALDEKAEAITAELTKSADEKFDAIADSLKKVGEAIEKVATVEAVESVKADLGTSLEALEGRIAALENSGAVQKSAEEEAEKASDKIEKGEGFWGDSFLPEYALQKG